MPLSRTDIESQVNTYFDGTYDIATGTTIPSKDDIRFGKYGKEMDLAMLFIDIRESTKIVNGFRRQTAAKMYKSFLWGVAKIARHNGGELRSFNGDGVLVAFAGEDRCSHAAKTAMQLSWFMTTVLAPKVDAYLLANSATADIKLKFGIGVDVGKVLIVRGGVRGDDNNDLVWVGNATNYSVKLSGEKNWDGRKIRITPSVYTELNDNTKFHTTVEGNKINMWEDVTGSARVNQMDLYRTNYHWRLS